MTPFTSSSSSSSYNQQNSITESFFLLCSLDLKRKALLPKVLNVDGAEAVLRSAFKSPFPDAPARSDVGLIP